MDTEPRQDPTNAVAGAAPERKYQVFLSSTFGDLADHRREATLGIVKARHIPIALEHYAPDTESKRAVIQAAIADCQFYVIILGSSYGTVDDNTGDGYVEYELNYALEKQLHVLAFVLDEALAREQRDALKVSNTAEKRELDNDDKFWALRQRLTHGRDGLFYRPFKSAAEIREELYHYFGKNYDVPGYIKEPKDKAVREAVHIYAQSQFVRTVVKRLGSFEGVEPRLGIAAEKKEAMGEAFRQEYEDNLRGIYDAVFIESGSTLSYVVEKLADILPHKGDVKEGRQRPEILTNNALAYLYLWLCSDVMCHPVPDGPPDEKYAGMFGPLTSRTREPDYTLPPLRERDPKGDSLIRDLWHSIFNSAEVNKSLILAASSGLQLSDSITPIKPKIRGKESEPYVGVNVIGQLQQCRGFHVGSYENKLFKRCLYLTKAPVIVFLHDDKLDSPVEVGKCHFLFDREWSWEQCYTSYPLELWVACSRETYEPAKASLERNLLHGDWRVRVHAEARDYPVLIAQNEAFRSAARAINAKIYC